MVMALYHQLARPAMAPGAPTLKPIAAAAPAAIRGRVPARGAVRAAAAGGEGERRYALSAAVWAMNAEEEFPPQEGGAAVPEEDMAGAAPAEDMGSDSDGSSSSSSSSSSSESESDEEEGGMKAEKKRMKKEKKERKRTMGEGAEEAPAAEVDVIGLGELLM